MPDVEEGVVCTGCKVLKPVTDFYKQKDRPNGIAARCKTCVAKYQKKHWEEYKVRRTYPNKDHGRTYHLKTKYGITPEQYAELLFLQGGVCKLCGEDCKSGKRLAVDHNHVTGEVRGLLCGNCNTALGLFGEDPEKLAQAIQYLKGEK